MDDVEKYGCHIVHVREDDRGPGWSYTIGWYKTFGQPEVVVVGLKTGTAQSLLNEVARRLKNGLLIEEGLRQRELLAKVECEFRRVEHDALKRVVGSASWFYSGEEFPVFQCIYPDLENRFSWEDSFHANWRKRQPLLFRDAPQTVLEKDFWASHDPDSSLFDWKFADSPHTGIFTTQRILNNQEPIVYVCHDAEDGTWQFHGPSDSPPESASYVAFTISWTRIDPSRNSTTSLQVGALGVNESDPWTREPKPPEQSS